MLLHMCICIMYKKILIHMHLKAPYKEDFLTDSCTKSMSQFYNHLLKHHFPMRVCKRTIETIIKKLKFINKISTKHFVKLKMGLKKLKHTTSIFS